MPDDKDKSKAPDTIEISPLDTPTERGQLQAPAPNPEVDDLRAELAKAQAEVDAARAELAAARSAAAEAEQVPVEHGAPKWVRVVSGMERSEIAGYAVIGDNLLIVKDKHKAEHRFSFLPAQREL